MPLPEECRSFESAQTTNQGDGNSRENSRNSEEAMQQQQEALIKEWNNQGLDSELSITTVSEENTASGSVSFGNIAQTVIVSSQQQPVATHNPAPIASSSREGFQLPNPAGYHGSEAQSGQSNLIVRQSGLVFPNTVPDLASINQFGNPTQQPISGQGKSDLVEEPHGSEEMEIMGASGPPSTPESIVQSQSSSSAQKVSEPTKKSKSGDDRTGFCVMCEEESNNIYQHAERWHLHKQKNPNPCYKIRNTFFSRTRILFPNCTNPEKELKKCDECQKVLYNHRYYKHGCSVPSTSSAQPDASYAAAPTSEKKIKGHCLMCKFTFDDLKEHRRQMHMGNKEYDIREVLGQWTLLPEKTLDKGELVKCQNCFKIMYKYQFWGSGQRKFLSSWCRTCRI